MDDEIARVNERVNPPRKANITSDLGWFMEVFNVTSQDSNKVTDSILLQYISKTLGADESVDVNQSIDFTVIELIGTDRSGLLSEITAILMNLNCNLVNAGIWTHKGKVAGVIEVTDKDTRSAISDIERLSEIRRCLGCCVITVVNISRRRSHELKTTETEIDGKLHQLMFADRDYEECDDDDGRVIPDVDITNLRVLDYSVVIIKCRDIPKLVFDTVFSLRDMNYVISHASIEEAYQEYFIRHIHGSRVESEEERERVIQCLKAAIQRRVSEVRLNSCDCLKKKNHVHLILCSKD